MSKAVFIDRDGVISSPFIRNGKSISPRKFKEFKLLPKVKKGILELKKKNFLTIVITNQPDISKEKLDIQEVNKMNNFLINTLGLDDLYMCPHQDTDNCKCRKPKTEMLKKSIIKYNIDISKSYVIGDRKTDILMANKIKCKSIFINRKYLEESPITQTITMPSFYKAAQYIAVSKG